MSQFKNSNNAFAEYKKISDLLEKKEFTIPSYQRAYSWRLEQIKPFLESFDEFFENEKIFKDINTSNYIGSILILKKIKTNTISPYEIIDGQQRITTIILIIIAIKNLFEKIITDQDKKFLIENYFGEKTIDHYKEALEIIKNSIFQNRKNDMKKLLEESKAGKNNEILLKPNITVDRDNLSYIALNNQSKVNKKSGPWLKNYEYIESYITDNIMDKSLKNFNSEEHSAVKIKMKLDNLMKYFLVITDKTIVLTNEISDIENAFSIFEALNDTGLKLTSFDLVNGWIQEKVKEKEQNLSFKQSFDTYIFCTNKIRIKNQANLDKYLAFWINSKFSNEISANNVFKEFKKYCKENLLNNVLEDIASSFDFLDKYFESETSDYNSKYILWLKRRKLIPLILLLKELNYNKKSYEIVNWAVKYSILELNISNTSPGKFQYRIQKIMKELKKSTNVFLSPKDLVKGIPDIMEDYEKYQNKNIFENIQNMKLTDFSLNKTLLLMLFEKENNLTKLNIHLIDADHCLPRKLKESELKKDKWQLIKDDEELRYSYTESLGNISFMSSTDNQKKSNKNFDQNIYNQNQEFLYKIIWNQVETLDNLTLEKIKERNNTLCKLMTQYDILDTKKYVD